MCNKAILGNDGALKSVPDCYKNQEMCNKAVDNVLEFVRECFMTLKICDKAVNTDPSTIKFFPKCFMTQEMYDKTVRMFFAFDSIPNQYKTQEMCDSVVSKDPFLWYIIR